LKNKRELKEKNMGLNNFQIGQNFCFYSYLSPRNGILVSAIEKERRERGLGAWFLSSPTSTEEQDLGEHQREGTGRV
jgi:hypothetical protein